MGALLLSGLLGYFLWARPVHGQPGSLYLQLTPAILLFPIGYWQVGLYPGFGLGPVETLRRYWLMTAGIFLALAAGSFALKIPHQYSRITTSIAFLAALALVPASRALVLRVVRRWHWWAEPVVLLGDTAGIRRAAVILAGRPGLGLRPIGAIQIGEGDSGTGLPVLGCLNQLPSIVPAGVEMALIDLRDAPATDAIERVRQFFPRVLVLREFDELPVEGVQVRNLGGVLGIEYSNDLLRKRNQVVKRSSDVLLSSVGLLIAAPIILAACAAVKVLDPGPALYWHCRAGRAGRSIRVPKIRTMVVEAEVRLKEHLEQDPTLRTEWQAGFKLRRDPRIIPIIGRFFRRFSIDELPQLWSVLRGDMSLVGPRPFPEYHLAALSPHSRRLRSEVRPGITGLWQVAARGVASLMEQEGYDIYYIRNWSLWLDLYVLAKTAGAVISGRGAY